MFSHNQAKRLKINDSSYRQFLYDLFTFFIEKDIGELGDISSKIIIPKNALSKGIIIAKKSGILAGSEEIKYLLKRNKIKCNFLKKDGSAIKNQEIICEIYGNLQTILKCERFILNLLSRMSGIATYTNSILKKIGKNILLCPTRKTLYGLLDKKAVTIGGGGTHRLGLDDAVLIKDNHLSFYNKNLDTLLWALKKKVDKGAKIGKFIEIETESRKDALKALSILSTFKKKVPLILMLDNMPVSDVRKIALYRKENAPLILLEASGGITEKNIKNYALTGVDIISMSALTLNSPSLDLSLEIN